MTDLLPDQLRLCTFPVGSREKKFFTGRCDELAESWILTRESPPFQKCMPRCLHHSRIYMSDAKLSLKEILVWMIMTS